MPEPQSFARRHRLPIHFIRCKDKNRMDCYFFLMCTHQKIKLLHQKIQTNDGVDTVNLALCGTIIASGFGSMPSEATIALLNTRHNYKLPDSLH